MTTRCPCCDRAFRRTKKPKAAETTDEAYKRIMTQVRAKIAANLKKPMPKSTPYTR